MQSILKRNPEFAKNVWLEINTSRLIVMPVVLALIFVVAGALGGDNKYDAISSVAFYVFRIIMMIWAVKPAADSIIDEYNGSTWDWQKMSLIGPWKMTWGKLFGSTIYNWYGAALCIIVILFCRAMTGMLNETVPSLIADIIISVLLQGCAVLSSLMIIRKAKTKKIRGNFLIIIALVIIVLGPFFILGSVESQMKTTWFGLRFGMFGLQSIIGLFYCLWVVAGIYRSLRSELQYTQGIGWWIAFVLSSVVFNAGFIINPMDGILISALLNSLLLACIFCCGLVYVMSILESKEIVDFRLMLHHLKERNIKSLLQIIPLWFVTAIFVFIFGILLCISFALGGELMDSSFTKDIAINGKILPICIIISCLLFMCRDLLVMLLINIRVNKRRAEGSFLIFLAVAYIPTSIIFGIAGAVNPFAPSFSNQPVLLIIYPLVQMVILYFFLASRWKKINAAL